jgi:hypothetical protein
MFSKILNAPKNRAWSLTSAPKVLGLALLGIWFLMGCATVVSWAQQKDRGVAVLKEGALNESGRTLGSVILEPLQLGTSLGYNAGGGFWLELDGAMGLWLGDIRVSSAVELRGASFTVSIDAETQLTDIGLSAGLRLGLSGVQLIGGIRKTLGDFNLAGQLALGSSGLGANASARSKLGILDLYAGVGLAGSTVSASAGAILPLIPDIVTLSGGISLDTSPRAAISGGMDFVISSALSFSANASLGSTGVMTNVGGHLSLENLSISAHGTWDSNGVGLTSRGEMRLENFDLLGTVRIDNDSFSVDMGASVKWEIFSLRLIVGFDQQGFKWAQLEVKGEFDVLGWLMK